MVHNLTHLKHTKNYVKILIEILFILLIYLFRLTNDDSKVSLPKPMMISTALLQAGCPSRCTTKCV